MSRYENYEIKNNVFGTLSAPISSLATTIQLWDWQGQRFSENMLATLENIENWKVIKREMVLITAISWDILTVVRKYAPCPANDDANTQWQVSYAFSIDDTISAYIDKEHFDNIKKNLDDIYDNWNDRLYVSNAWWLKIHITWWNARVWWGYIQYTGGDITLTDNATNYIMIDWAGTIQLSTSGWDDDYARLAEIITSGWNITNINRWKLDTIWWTFWVDIHSLPAKTEAKDNDELLLADSEDWYSNKKATLSDAVFGVWLNCLSEKLIVWEKYSSNDKLFKQQAPISNNSMVEYNIWDINTNTQVQIQRIASGIASNAITLKIKTNWSPTTALHCDVFEWLNYDVSETEIAWKASWTAIATSSLASSNFSNSFQEITFTLNNNIGWTRWQLLSIVLYQNNNTVDSSNYYIIACDNDQWSEAFRAISYNWTGVYTTNYLMPYCDSNAFEQYLLCKVDNSKKTVNANATITWSWSWEERKAELSHWWITDPIYNPTSSNISVTRSYTWYWVWTNRTPGLIFTWWSQVSISTTSWVYTWSGVIQAWKVWQLSWVTLSRCTYYYTAWSVTITFSSVDLYKWWYYPWYPKSVVSVWNTIQFYFYGLYKNTMLNTNVDVLWIVDTSWARVPIGTKRIVFYARYNTSSLSTAQDDFADALVQLENWQRHMHIRQWVSTNTYQSVDIDFCLNWYIYWSWRRVTATFYW